VPKKSIFGLVACAAALLGGLSPTAAAAQHSETLSLRIGSFAPFLRARWDRNASTLGICTYHRLAGEARLASAF
jgi:hypothetical protein